MATSAYNGCTQESLSVTANTQYNNNQITAFSYDASGNVLNDTHNSYTWDAESEIKTAAGVTYIYDGDGNRLQKSSGKIYWYGAGTEILDESGSSGITDEYVYFGGKRVAHRVVSGNVISYYGEDFLGTSRQIYSSTSAICYDADFYPFGGERPPYTNSCSPTYKFEGKERDTETNNDDFGARYYSSSFGRWTSPDWSAIPAPVPYANLTNPQTLNLYAMVADDPETFADLDGHDIKYADGLKNAQLVRDTVDAILSDPNTSVTLSGYVGPNNPDLIIQSGDLSNLDTTTRNPDGSVTTTTVQGGTEPDIQTSTTTSNGVTSAPETQLNSTTITIDNRTSEADTEGVMVHEATHAGDARANPGKYAKDAAAERSNPNHDSRPQEKRANAAQKAYTKEIKRKVKQIEKARKKQKKESK